MGSHADKSILVICASLFCKKLFYYFAVQLRYKEEEKLKLTHGLCAI